MNAIALCALLVAVACSMPTETRNYVKKVTGSWVSYSALDGDVADVDFALTVSK